MTQTNNSSSTLHIDESCRLGGQVICENPIRIFHSCTLNWVEIGAFSYVSPGCLLHQLTIGRYSSIGDDVQVLSAHPIDRLTTSPFPYHTLFSAPFDAAPQTSFTPFAKTIIGNDVWIGSGVRLKSGITIGDGAIVGAASVVTKNVAPYSIVGGAPAKFIRYRFDEKAIEELVALQWWEYNLLGLELPWDNVTETLRELLARIKSRSLLPYESERYAVFREGSNIHARRLKSHNLG